MKKRRKKKRRSGRILVVLAILITGGILALNYLLGSLVKKEVYNQLNRSSKSLYILHFDEVKINIFNGSLKLINLTVTPSDSANKLLHEGKINKLLKSHVPVFKITNLKILDFIQDHIIRISEIDLTGFTVDYMVNSEAKEPENKKTLVLHQVFSDKFRGAEIGTIRVNAKALNFYHSDKKDSSFFEIDSVRVSIDGVRINPETLKQPFPAEIQNIRISTGHFSLNSLKYYSLSTSDIQFDIRKSSLLIEGFKLTPKFSKAEYNKKIRYNNDLFSISTESIQFNGLSLQEIVTKELVSFSSIQISGPVIDIYRDKRLPDAPFKYKPLLAGMVRKIPVNLNIDTIAITGGKLKYEEQTDAGDQPGTVFFDPFYITAYHVTNNAGLITQNPEMSVDFRGKIMAEAILQARLAIDLAGSSEVFRISGNLEPVSGPAFNPMVEQLLPVRIQTGDIKKTSFSFTANDDISHGELLMDYENLLVEVIKGKEHGKKAGLITAVANGLIRGQNMPDHGKYITGTIRFERRKDKAIVNFLWNSCKTGIIGIVAPIADRTKKEERKEMKDEKKAEKKMDHGKNKE